MTNLLKKGLRFEIQEALNRESAENSSDTPDFILAQFLISSLHAFDLGIRRREEWYGRNGVPTPTISHDPINSPKSNLLPDLINPE